MLTKQRAIRLAAVLDLDVSQTEICPACLSFVSFALDSDTDAQIRGAVVKWTPVLWDEGLELPLRLALEQARAQRLPDAAHALADINAAGPRTTIARAAVERLAHQLSLRTRAMMN
jgi:hypothetical protein